MATIGPRTTQGSDFPSQVVSCLFCCIYAVVGLRTVLEWSEGLVCLINLVCLGATPTELEGWLSSPQPLNSTQSQGLRDYVVEKGLIPCVGCVLVS